MATLISHRDGECANNGSPEIFVRDGQIIRVWEGRERIDHPSDVWASWVLCATSPVKASRDYAPVLRRVLDEVGYLQ